MTSLPTRNRLALYNRIKSSGILMAPCTRCRSNELECRVVPGYSRCAECVRRGGSVKCDVHGPSEAEWLKLEKEEAKLNNEWSESRDALIQLQARLLEAQSKMLRLDKQREMFRSRAAEMLRRGLNSFAELETEEEKERQTSTSAPEPPPLSDEFFLNPSTDVRLSTSLAPFDPSDPFWASLDLPLATTAASSSHDWDVSSGTPPVGPGN